MKKHRGKKCEISDENLDSASVSLYLMIIIWIFICVSLVIFFFFFERADITIRNEFKTIQINVILIPIYLMYLDIIYISRNIMKNFAKLSLCTKEQRLWHVPWKRERKPVVRGRTGTAVRNLWKILIILVDHYY